MSREKHGWSRARIVVTAVAAATMALVAGCSTPATPSAPQGRVIGPDPLGANVAAWDAIFNHVHHRTITRLLESARLTLLRYPGGGWADKYDWATNTDSSDCTDTSAPTGSACDDVDPLSFDTFSAKARAAGASTFVTVNYGSGTPAEAAAWVRRAATKKRDAVALWEVGNETYGCFETNAHLAQAPTFVKGYRPYGPVCPSTAVLAKSYAHNALAFVKDMKRANPRARIGVPWAFSQRQAAGAGVRDASLWNTRILRVLGRDVSFVDAHWYPFSQVSGLSDRQILRSVLRIPAAAAQIRTTLHREAPGASFVVGETNISELATTLNFKPVSALFAAATSLEWLAQGAGSVDWWDLNNDGSPGGGDFGLLSSGNPEAEPTGTPFPPYYGEELAAKLTTPGSRIKAADTGSSQVLGFESDLPQVRCVLLVNAGSYAISVDTARWFPAGSTLHTFSYSGASAGAASPVVNSTAAARRAQALPAESIVVLRGSPGS